MNIFNHSSNPRFSSGGNVLKIIFLSANVYILSIFKNVFYHAAWRLEINDIYKQKGTTFILLKLFCVNWLVYHYFCTELFLRIFWRRTCHKLCVWWLYYKKIYNFAYFTLYVSLCAWFFFKWKRSLYHYTRKGLERRIGI